MAGVAAQAASKSEVVFTVRGLPAAQGSSRAFVNPKTGRAFVATEGNRASSPLGAWRTAIATEARAEMEDAPCLEGPVAVRVVFSLRRPRSHYLPANGQRPVPELRVDAPHWHLGKPDADKLIRSLLDALTGVVFRDDGQVASLTVWKTYEGPEAPTGCVVRVSRLEATR